MRERLWVGEPEFNSLRPSRCASENRSVNIATSLTVSESDTRDRLVTDHHPAHCVISLPSTTQLQGTETPALSSFSANVERCDSSLNQVRVVPVRPSSSSMRPLSHFWAQNTDVVSGYLSDMGFVSDLIHRENPQRRQQVQGLADSIAGEIKFIERTANDIIERVNKFLNVQRGPVSSDGKKIDRFLLEVRRAFEDLNRNAKEQYMQLSAKVDTTVVESVRQKVLGLDLDCMHEGIRELEIAGVKMKDAVGMVTTIVTTSVMTDLEGLVCLSVKAIGGLVAGSLAGALVFVIWEAISGLAEGAELKRRIKELEETERTLRSNGTAISNCADQLRFALVVTQIQLGKVGNAKELSFGYVLPLTLYLLFKEY